jgi:hypothetical protein
MLTASVKQCPLVGAIAKRVFHHRVIVWLCECTFILNAVVGVIESRGFTAPDNAIVPAQIVEKTIGNNRSNRVFP